MAWARAAVLLYLKEMATCPVCHEDRFDGQRCAACGFAVLSGAPVPAKRRCARCGTEYEGDPKRCPGCRTVLRRSRPSPSEAEAEPARCRNCGVPYSGDRGYCLNCGDRRRAS